MNSDTLFAGTVFESLAGARIGLGAFSESTEAAYEGLATGTEDTGIESVKSENISKLDTGRIGALKPPAA